MVWNGSIPTVTAGFYRLVYLIFVGLLIGLLVGIVVEWFEHHIDDGPIEIVISILVPYATYLGANAARSSGVSGRHRMRFVSQPPQFSVFFAERATARRSRLGIAHLHP